ncbi:hypothetical protein DEJ23_14785 [Curtobacterium sp. MCSS17_008]|uniref:choice-of-anchor G family protein n=1 Tax=Curtobacterium sp. MCSS17_008 TaxID=2175647 RepID=UPI000DA89DD3|nr:choice-of-anchor G family protein [Curtobacterium sp. MCSS17_008]PZF53286.1 hypothetical protein DEJ23_14785 [Curtobacterium sp. MCSS17_008]
MSSSTASWTDREWTRGGVGTSAFRCGTDDDYTSRSASRFLSGTLAGTDLDSVATVEGVDVTKTGTTGATVDPVTAPEITSDRTTAAFGNPLDVGLLGDVLGLNLTGLGVGLPAGSAGAVNQIAKSSATGESTAAAGLVNNSGGLLVTDSTPTDQLPEPASLDVGQALPAISGITDVGLEVGAVGSTAQLDGCGLLEDQIWGAATGARNEIGSVAIARTATTVAAAPAPHVVRNYGIASLDLRVDSPLVGSLVQSVNNTIGTLDQSVTALAGTNGLLSQAIQQNIVGALTNGLGLGTVSGTVAVDGAKLAPALTPVLTQPLTDGTLTVDLATGTVRVDLAHLLGDDAKGLNDLPPNTEIVLDAALLNDLTARLGTLLDTWTERVVTLLTTLLQDLTIKIALNVNLNLLGVPLVQLNIRMDSGVHALMAGRSSLTVGTTLLGLNLGLLTGVVSALVAGLVNGLPAVILSTLTTNLLTPASTLGSTLAGIVRPLLTAVGSVLSFLPGLLSLTVNVQEERPGARDGTAVRTGTYSVAALRIQLLSAMVSGSLARIDLASSAVGPAQVNLRPALDIV